MLLKLLFLGALCAPAFGLYGAGSNVIELTDSNFDKLVIKGDEIWVVEFYAPWCGHCQQLVPEYKKLATALKGVAKVGSLNADEFKSTGGQYGVKGFPTIKIFGANKRKPDDYNGERTASAMANAAVAAAKRKVTDALGGDSSSGGSSDGGDDVVELTDDNFKRLVLESEDMWLVEFFAPWCGHCKNLAPHWSKAASSLKGKVKLGALDATVHTSIASTFGIQGYPTIKYFGAGRKTGSDGSGVDYDGGRTAADITAWALDKLAENIKAPELRQITDADVFAAECDRKPLCVVAVLPHILDCQADCRERYQGMLVKMGDKYKQKMWGWLWTEGGAQFELEDSLDIGGFGYPAMAVVNVKKMKYSLFRGSFSKDGVDEFLRDLSFGRGNTAPVKGGSLPQIVTTAPWDGKDGELPQEEDIDLTDFDLDKDEL